MNLEDFDESIRKLTTLDDQIATAKKEGKTSGSYTCECGGKVSWASDGPRAMAARCDTCDFRAIS